MEKRKHNSNQIDLLAQDPQQMQWENLVEQERDQTQCLLAQLVFSLFSHWIKLQNKQEPCHAVKNNV